jgi:hypothetical protein
VLFRSSVSDRAFACPGCGCPVTEVLAERRQQQARERAAQAREIVEGAEADCPRCEARGFYTETDTRCVAWCAVCEHTGRVCLGRAEDGFYAVARYATQRFLAGELHPDRSGVVFFLGEGRPSGHRFPRASPRGEVDPSEIPW